MCAGNHVDVIRAISNGKRSGVGLLLPDERDYVGFLFRRDSTGEDGGTAICDEEELV
jgi:hypothetical protein